MKCPKCQFENRERAKFCGKCGEKLSQVCPHCKSENPPDNKFCDECGQDLRESQAPPIDFEKPQSYTPKFLADKILTNRSSIEGERKLVTVLFADVANYTSMSERLDPEEVHQIMDGCFQILMNEIHKYEGTINQFTGDGIMALFGAPVAHEDHAQRACHSALSIQRAMEEYGSKVKDDYDVEFRIRIGLNSGPVIVGSIGDDLRMDYTAVGDTTNLAARVQQVANPGEVWVSQDTHNIVQNYFQYDLLEQIPLKGKAQPQHIYHLIAERPGVRTRFEAGIMRGMTELVGRRPEMEALRGALRRAKEGEGQVVDVVGEAGVGKSRLVYEFQKGIADEVIFLTGNCIQYGRNINFLPVIDVIKDAFGIHEGLTEVEVGNRIEDKATQDLARMIPFYRSLLSLKVQDPKFDALEPEGRKFGTFEAVKNLFIALSEQKPLVVFIDDAHWIDKLSEALLTYLARSIIDQRILMLSAYRPEGSPSWAQGAHYQRLGVETLSSKSSGRLVRNMLGVPALEPNLEEKIVEKAEGNPFFVEEIVRELVDRGDIVKSGDRYICGRPIEQCEIPNTIQGMLAARMDRLSEDLKRTMQVASVIGRNFAFRLLKSIMELGDELRSQMANLVGLEILYEKALYPELEYIFKHTLTQEVAYDSLLKQRRREIHGRIAQAIEELYADRLEDHYESLAHHYEESGKAAKAVDYLVLAGEKSNRIGAAQAALEFLKKALEVSQEAYLKLNPEAEVRLHYDLASAQHAVGALGDSVKGLTKAIAISRQHRMVDYEKKSLTFLALSMHQWPGRVEAQRTLEEGMARAREMDDKGLESTMLLAMATVALGDYGQRAKVYQMVLDGEKLALASAEPSSVLLAHWVRAVAERFLGRPRKAIELTEGMVEKALDMFNIASLSFLAMHRGAALAEMGRIEESISLIKNGIESCEKFGVPVYLAQLYNCLGYCYGEIYQLERAWECYLKSEEIAHRLLERLPMGRRIWAHALGHAETNLVDNLLDRGKMDEAWERIKATDQRSKGEDFGYNRYQWESRMNYLASHILVRRNDLDQAEALIQENLKKVRDELMKKREGSFLRLLGDVQVRRNEHESAVTTLIEAIHILMDVENPRQVWQARASLGSALEGLNRHSEARAQWRAAAEVINKTASNLADRELRDGFLRAGAIKAILSRAQI
jgi:class 3 adenylate cyclase/tetratricopeptide (TPR) repeat protein